MNRTLAGLVAVLALLAGACSSTVEDDDPRRADAIAAAEVGADVAAPADETQGTDTAGEGGAGTPPPGDQPTEGVPPTAPPSGEAEPSAPPGDEPPPIERGERHNNGAITIDMSSECVNPGSTVVITLNAQPRAGVSAVIGFSDGEWQGPGTWYVGESDDSGTVTWPVAIPLTAPDGEATVLASTTGPDWEGEGGSADKKFQVGGC